MKKKSVIEYLDSAKAKVSQSNRTKFRSILKTIMYCGTHDLSLRKKLSQSGNFEDLLDSCVDSVGKILEGHLRTYPG